MLANDRPSARRHPTRRNPVPPLNKNTKKGEKECNEEYKLSQKNIAFGIEVARRGTEPAGFANYPDSQIGLHWTIHSSERMVQFTAATDWPRI